jgi:hypothetical protein
MDPERIVPPSFADPDPRILTSDLTYQDADPGGPKAYGSGTLVLVHLILFSKINSLKEVTKQYLIIKVFLTGFA